MLRIAVTHYHFTSLDSAVSEQQHIAHTNRGVFIGEQRKK